MGYRLRILAPAEARGFGHMTFPAYRPLLGNGTLAVGAYSRGEPVGLALAVPSKDRKNAELVSLYVDLVHRSKGVGGFLLAHAGRRLARAGVKSVNTAWSETVPGRIPFERVLAKGSWSAPSRRMLVLKGRMDGNFGAALRALHPRYESVDCLPRRYTMSPWRDMTVSDRRFILSRRGRPGWYAPDSNPFREHRTLEPDNSLLLKKEGEIAGWLTVHRTTPDTLRYSDVFIREDLKRSGVAIAMVMHGFWLQLKGGTPALTMAVDRGNEPLVRMFERRVGDKASLNWTLGSEKTFGE